MPSINNVTLTVSHSKGPDGKGRINATAGSKDPLQQEYVGITITDEDGIYSVSSAFVQKNVSLNVTGLNDSLYTVIATGSLKPDFEVTQTVLIDYQPTPNITITPNLTTPGTIRLDITSVIDIATATYTSGTTLTETIISSKHRTVVAIIDSQLNLLTFTATITDITGYSEYLDIYYRKVSYTKNCGANQTGSYTSTKTSFSLISINDAYIKALNLATADADANLVCDTDIKFEEVEMTDTSFTVSYSVENQSWVCFHDYKPDAILCTANLLMSFKETKIYIHNQYNKKGRFYNQLPNDVPFKSQIEFVAPNLITKAYHSISWKTQVKIEGIVNEYLTFDTVMIYNHNQCSGEVTVIPHKTTRNAEGVWRFNDFRDLMKSQDSKFLDDKGNVIPDAISINKPFYKQARFISDYICSRLTFNNKEVYTEIVLSDFSINDKVSYR